MLEFSCDLATICIWNVSTTLRWWSTQGKCQCLTILSKNMVPYKGYGRGIKFKGLAEIGSNFADNQTVNQIKIYLQTS